MVKDNIIQIDSRKAYMENMARYSLYILYDRYTPDIRDGLKPVQRRIVYAMWNDVGCTSIATKRKSANTTGIVMAKYHPHGDCLRSNTPIYTLNGVIANIGDLYNSGVRTFEALGINETTGKVEPVIVHSLRIGQYTDKVYHITLSNGAEIQCTSNHPIMLYNGEYIKAENITKGMVLKTEVMTTTSSTGRPYIRGNGLVQNIVYDYYNPEIKDGYNRHHKDSNILNNTRNNLISLSDIEHGLEHGGNIYGLEKGRNTLFNSNSTSALLNTIKNKKLTELYSKDHNYRKFRNSINKLIEMGLDVTEDNYETLRPIVYNLPKISSLINRGYGKDFNELVENIKNIESIHSLYEEYKSTFKEMCTIVNESDNSGGARYMVFKRIDELLLCGLIPTYNVYMYSMQWDYKGSLTEEQYNAYLSEYYRVKPFVVDVRIENVNQEPMYDFTVDTTHNMLIPAVGATNVSFGEMPMVCVHNSGSYGAMKALTNWFEIKVPLINYDSNAGSLQGGPQAASRYTESYLSKFAMDCVIGELQEVREVVDWQKTFDNHTVEPECLPVKVPLLLVNGCFGIAIGSRIESPKHSLNDVIDATIAVLRDPKAKVVLIPDPCQKCEIIDTDWKKISNTGYGYYIERGIINIEHNNKTGIDTLHILSTPDLIFYNSIAEKIEELITDKKLVQIADIQDQSSDTQLDIHIILKKGSDPNYVKQVLYKNTPLQDTKRVNMKVINGTDINCISYKAYISYFLEFRRSVKFRLYNFRLQKVETRLHELDTYIKILESGDVENIIHMIRNQSSMDENYLIEWLMKKLKITDLQAKFVLRTQIGKLSKGHLNKYKEEQIRLCEDVNRYINMITNEKLIDQEIEQELLEIKAKYGRPRQSVLISESEASNIPEGEFKLVITEQNYIKKLQVNDPIKVVKGDNPKCVIIADNSKDILLFDQMGKVFRLPVHKISFTDKNSPGLDIRLILKKLTSNIISVMYLPIIEHLQNKSSKHFLVTVTKNGLIKRIDLDDIINATPSGIIYSKLNQNDTVCDILIANQKSDVIVYTKSKALRMPIEQIPYLKRSTLGNQAMRTDETIDGISVITSDTRDMVIVTAKGRFNRISQAAFPRSERNKAGTKVIKLTKGDYIINIFSCSGNNTIRVVRPDEILTIQTDEIPIGSSVSQGVKLCKDGIIKAELIKN